MNKNRRITLIIIALPFVFGLAKAQDHSSYYTESHRKNALEIYRTSIGFRTAKTHGLVERVPVKSFFGALQHWRVILHELAGR